jgi:hypothetical protein
MLNLRKFFVWFCLAPEKSGRPACPHCGGIRCFGACQFDAGKTKDRDSREKPPDRTAPQ